MPQRILVIDDDQVIRQFVAVVLEPAGFTVHSAPDGAEGLAMAAAEPPDLVLLDVMMPGLDGYQVCQALGQEEATAAVPVIMLTASPEPALNRKAYAAGAKACVPKPFRAESLIATMHAVLAAGSGGGRPAGRPLRR